MSRNCQCPPVASRGVFKYLTYLIPIRQCSQHRGPGIVYRGVVKLREGASILHYYISSIPLGPFASYMNNNIEFGSNVLNYFIGKCSFFLNVVKPPLEGLISYLSTYYSREDHVEETESVSESIGQASTSAATPMNMDGSAKHTGSEKFAGLDKVPELEKLTGLDKLIGSTTPSGTSDIEIKARHGQVKTEPPGETPCRLRRFLDSILRFFQYLFNVILSSFQNVFNGILSTLQNVFNGILSTLQHVLYVIISPFQYAFDGMAGILKGTKDTVVRAGTCSYDYMSNCPLWIYLYIIFVCLTVGYIVYQTYITYKGRLWSRANKIPGRIREGCREFIIPDSTLKQVMAKLRTEIDKGLNPRTKPSSSVKCFTTYVQDLPTGEENGKFLALDLGGTNFRVLLITLNGRHFDMQSKTYVIPEDVMVGTSKNLFNHIAVCLADFTIEHKVNKDNLPLGFTFSFPLNQEGLSKGVLQRWTKGFNCPEAIGQDVVELLREAIDAHGNLHIDVMAILNDTTGTLMSCAWKNHNTKIGVILGTGTNACYIEKIENVIDFDGDKSKPIVLINTEWGAFGDNGELDFIRTAYDKEVDVKSRNPGCQIHEKLISGMYLGEIVRLLLVKFISEKLILDGKLNDKIQKPTSVPSKFLSEVESDKRGCFKECRKALAKIGYTQVTDEDCNSVRFVCECVSRRAAHLASAALATLINKMGYSSLTIGVDGSLYRYHPHFHDLMVQKISQLIDDKIMNVNLMLSEDGSGRGAALVAASIY